MPVDTSSYPTQSQPINPLQTMTGAASLQNIMNQNRLFQQQFNTNLAVSNIYKQAMNPDGTINQEKLTNLLASDPNASYGLPQAYQGSQEATQRNLSIGQAQLELAKKNFATLQGYLNPLVANPNVSPSDVYNAAAQAISLGHVDPNVIAKYLADMPRDPTQLAPWLKQHQMQALSMEQQFNAMNPTPTMVQTPQGQIPMRLPQVGAPSQAGPEIPNVPGPTTPVYKDGQMTYFGNQPNGGQPMPNGQPGGAGGQVGLAPGTPAAPPLGAEAAANVVSGGSAKAYQELRNDVAGTATRLFQLNQALTGIKGAQTGPGSQSLNNARSFLLTLDPGILKAIGLTDPNKVKNYDEANKYLTAYAINQASSLGQGTDEKLASAITANASTHISNLAAQDVIKANMALEKMKQAQASAFQQSGLGPEQYSDWAVKWNKSADPRAFLVDNMNATDRAKMIDSMKPSEKRKFLDTLKAAINTGVINLKDLAAGGGQ